MKTEKRDMPQDKSAGARKAPPAKDTKGQPRTEQPKRPAGK